MSTTDSPPPQPTGSGPRITGQEARDLRRLRRTSKASPEGRHIAGVAGGIARHFDIDPVLVRVLLVVLVFFGGSGLLLYGAGWLFVPEEGSDQGTIPLDDRNRSLALYVAAGIAGLAFLGDTVGSFDFPWPLVLIILVLLVVLGTRDRVKAPDRKPFGGPPPDETANAPYAPEAPASGTATASPVAPPASEPPAYGPSAYAPPAYGPPAYGPPTYGPSPYVPQPHPRRRGPILFWFTLALIALGLGVLGIVDAAPNTSIPGSAYPALVVGITGVMLVLGAFWGRAGGLILVGLLATVGLVGATASHEFDDHRHRIHAAPLTASDVDEEYSFNAGEMVLDLTRIGDPAALDGRTIKVEGGVGRLSVVVPDGWGVHAETDVGVGNAQVLSGDESGGLGVSKSGSESGDVGAPTVRFDINLGVGSAEVLRASDFAWPDHNFSGWSTRP